MAKDIDFPPVWLAGFAAVGGVLGLALPIRLAYNEVIGSVLIVAGFVLVLTAAAQMMIARTTLIPRRDPDALVTSGVFRFSRNPIYLGDAIVLAGLLIAWDALISLPLVAVFVLVITRRFILEEEGRLLRLFGEPYGDYMATTRRWL